MFLGIAISLTARLLSTASPAALFAAGEVGVWYDPSDLTTLFQDSAGTTPVTAAGQPVGLMLDKSKSLALGSELVSNGDFSNGLTGWLLIGVGNTTVVSGGVAQISGTSSVGLRAANIMTIGNTYRISLRIRRTSGSAIAFYTPNIAPNPTLTTEWQTVTYYAAATDTKFEVGISGVSTGTVVEVDDISVKLLAGNHATQATAAQRPTYGIHPYSGVRNRANGSADVGNATYWPAAPIENGITATKVGSGFDTDGLPYVDVRYQGLATGTSHNGVYPTANSRFPAASGQSVTGSVIARVTAGSTANTSGLSVGVFEETAPFTFIGANSSSNTTASTDTVVSATRSISTGNQSRVIVSLTFTLATTIDITYRIKGLQLELGSTRTAYQANYSQYNITEAGVPSVHYIGFDGVDDGMVTSAIDFSATDAVTVFAGVRKLSDAARAMLYELGPTTATASIRLEAPNTPAVGQYITYSNGSLSGASANTNAASAPITSVVTSVSKISTDTLLLRLNGTQVASSATDQGAGNYAANQLYIGRRGGVALPFNGNIYSLIVRGAQSTGGQITSTETWVNGKTGAY